MLTSSSCLRTLVFVHPEVVAHLATYSAILHTLNRVIEANHTLFDIDSRKHRQRQPDKDILDHARKREIEVKVFELRDKLEEEGIDEEAIETQTEALRRKLVKENKNSADLSDGKNIKIHDVHGLAEAKIKQDHRLRNALGISSNYEEGDHWKKQEEREKLAAERHGNGEKHK